MLMRLRGLAPAAVENSVGRGDARRCGRVLAPHDARKNVDRASGMAPRQRANLRECFRHYANASHTATAMRPANVSEIRYAVISLSVNQMCGMIAARNH